MALRKILVIAKHDFYLESFRKTNSNFNVKFLTGSTLEDLEILTNKNPEIEMIFFPHFSEIIPERVFSKYTCIGFHTGRLPLDKGGSPIQHQIMNGIYSTKVSAIKIEKSIDGGPIYAHRNFDLSQGNISDILRELSRVIADMIFELVSHLPEPIPQKGDSSVHRRLTASDSKLEIEKLSNRQIFDHIRMLDGLDYPKAFIEIGGKKMVLTSAEFDGTHVSFRVTIGE